MENIFWTILVMSAVVSVLISCVFTYLYFNFRKRFFLELSVASIIYAAHIPIINIIIYNFSSSFLAILLDKLLLLSASFLFVHAVTLLTETMYKKIIGKLYIVSLFSVVLLEYYCQDLFAKGVMGLIIFSISFVYCGILFFRNRKFKKRNSLILGTLFTLWGLVPYLYIPYFLNETLPVIPVALIYTIKLLINIFILILFFDEARKELVIKNFELSTLENTKKKYPFHNNS